jgi:hypothetical protein
MHQVINQSTSEETENNHLTNIILKCANNPSPETNSEISTHKSRQTHKQICLLQAWIYIYPLERKCLEITLQPIQCKCLFLPQNQHHRRQLSWANLFAAIHRSLLEKLYSQGISDG